jgi:hypothetical protein
VVTLRSPSIGSTVSGTISIVARMAPSVAWANFYLDSVFLASSPPDDAIWDTTTALNGSHILTVKAFDASDRQIGIDSIAVFVSNSASPPGAIRASADRSVTHFSATHGLSLLQKRHH